MLFLYLNKRRLSYSFLLLLLLRLSSHAAGHRVALPRAHPVPFVASAASLINTEKWTDVPKPRHDSLDVTPPREELLGPDGHRLVQVAIARDVVDEVERFPLHLVLVRRPSLALILLVRVVDP